MVNLLYLMMFFILFLFLSLTWHQLMAMTPEESIVFSAIFIMVCVFFLGIIGKAELIYTIMIIFSVLGLLAFLVNFSLVKSKDHQSMFYRIGIFLSPSIIILCVIFVYTIVAFKGAMFTYPDEIFQWGPAVKYIYDTGSLYYSEDFTGEIVTLSIASMFQYTWTGLGAFYEKNCIIGNFILAFIPVFLPFSGTGWKNWKKVALYTIMLFLSLNVLTYVKYYTLLQDFILPLWAGSVVAWLLWKKTTKINLWVFFGALICIGAMKSMVGPLFVGIIMILYLVNDFVLEQRDNVISLFCKKNLLMLVLSALSGYSITFVWSLLLKQNVLDRSNPSGQVQKSINDIVNSVIGKTFYIYSNPNESFPNVSYFIMFSILLMLIYYLYNTRDAEYKNKKIYMVALKFYALGFVGYLLIMIYAYITVFGVNDSKNVAGLERYLAYYMILGVPTIVSLLVKEKLFLADNKKSNVVIIGMLLVLIFATGNNFVEKVSTIYIMGDSDYKLRLEMKSIGQTIRNITNQDGKIFLLGEIGAGESKCLTYELGRQYTWNEDCYKMYIRAGEDSVIYCNAVKYPSVLVDLHYSYIWCYDVSEENKYNKLKYYYGLQDIKDGDFYKLYFEDGKIEAVLLGNIKSPEKK